MPLKRITVSGDVKNGTDEELVQAVQSAVDELVLV